MTMTYMLLNIRPRHTSHELIVLRRVDANTREQEAHLGVVFSHSRKLQSPAAVMRALALRLQHARDDVLVVRPMNLLVPVNAAVLVVSSGGGGGEIIDVYFPSSILYLN